jgi:Large polyvalent protein associated domain 22/Large polyvalent protein-associated domain 3
MVMADVDNAIDSYFGQQRQQTVDGLKLSVSNALTVNPDQEAEARRVASTLKIPVDAVRDNLPEAQQQIQMQQTDFGMLADRFPKTSTYLSNQQNANIAHDDVANLSSIESLFNSETPRLKQMKPALEQIGGFVKNTGSAILSGAPAFNEGAWGLLRAGSEFLPDAVGKPLTEFSAGMGQKSRSIKNDLMAKPDSLLEQSWYSGMQSLGLNVLQLPLGITGKMAPILTSMGLTTGGQAYGEARDKGVDKSTALVYGTSQGVIEAGTEMIGMPALFSLLKPGHFGTKALEYFLKEQGGEQIATALQDLNDWAILPENKDKSVSDYLSDRPSAAIQTALATTFGGGGQVALIKGIQLATARGDAQVEQADNAAELLTQLNTLATASKVRARDAESFQTFLQSALEDGPVDHIYIEPKALAQTLDQAGISLAEFTKTSPLVSAQLQESLATNTDLSIPIAEFATHLAGQTYSQQLIEHLKTDPQGMSRAEAQEFIKTQGEVLQAEVERVLGKSYQDQSFNDSRDRVYQAVLDNLNETNRFTAQKNEIDATLIATRTAVRAAQLRMTPEELFNKHLLKVAGDGFESTTGDVVLNQKHHVVLDTAFLKTEDQSTKSIKKAAADYAKKNFANSIVKNESDGQDIIISKQGIKHGASGTGSKLSALALSALDQVISRAKYTHSEPDDKNRNTIKEVRFYETTVNLGDEKAKLKIVVRVANDGNRYYDHYEIENPAGQSGKLTFKQDSLQPFTGLLSDEDIASLKRLEPKSNTYNQSNPIFYSGLARAVMSAKQVTAPAKDWLPIINSLPGVKKEEIEWSGIKDYLELKGKEKLTKEQVAQFINENGVQLSEVELGNIPLSKITEEFHKQGYDIEDDRQTYAVYFTNPEGEEVTWEELPESLQKLANQYGNDQTKYSKYTLPGGENYKELLITLSPPAPMPQPKYQTVYEKYINGEKVAEGLKSTADRWIADDPNVDVREVERKAPVSYDKTPKVDGYKSSHWDQQNVLAHIRFNDRTDSDGNKVLFVEEIQSDWHQAGRKRGYMPKDAEKLEARRKEIESIGVNATQEQKQEWADIMNKLRPDTRDTESNTTGYHGVPDAPLKDTKAWTGLAIKRIARYAAENGYDKVAFVNGEQSASRYDLSKHIDKLEYTEGGALYAWDINGNEVIRKKMPESEVEDHVGKDLAKKLLDSEKGKYNSRTLEGADLKVGGEGMVNYYDKIVPQVVNEVLKKTGGGKIAPIEIGSEKKVTYDQIQTAERRRDFDEAERLTYTMERQELGHGDESIHGEMESITQLGFTVTPEIRQAVMSGQTLFQAHRGQIAFGSDISKSPSIITLLKSADLSTFLHESGHFFFESDINLAADLSRTANEMGASFLTEGERQLMGDVSKMLEWHGLQGTLNDQLNQWYTLSTEEKRSYHERTAESFERYLFEGKAPSIELQRIFQAFRAWLMNVYKSIEDFVARNPEAGKLDDSIRQVFDRMLASTEQIQLAEQGRSMMPLFESADQAGMTTEEFAAYHALDLDASMEAVSSLEAKGLKDMQWMHNARGKIIKKLQKQNVARRAEVMMDARREVLSQPIYRAWTFLTNRMDKDQKIVPDELPKSDKDSVTPEVDSMFTAIAKLGGLKRDEIDALMGLDPKMKSPMPAFGKYVFKRNGGESLDFMGEILANYGYLTVDEHGKFDTRELEDKLDAELRGEPQYAIGVDPRLLGQEGRAGEGLNLEEIGAGRLDFGELVGLPVPREQINQLEAMKMVAMNGIHPDLVAEQFGISSGDELVQSFLTLPNPKEAIANLTDQMMLERYGDITSPEALEKAADMAIHNEARAKFVATELNALNKATGKPKVLISAAKEFAKNMIDRLIIRNLKPAPYAASEVRAAKAAEKALKEGKLEQAAADKRNQIINTYATKAVYDAQEEVEKGLRYLAKFDNEGTRKALDVDYLDQIDAILERFDLRKGTTLKNIDKRKSLAAWITQQEELGIEVDLPNKVKAEAYRQSYKDMSVEELRGLIDSIKQIEHLGRLKEKLLTAQDKRRFSDIINQMVQSVEESSHHRQIDNRTRDTLGNRATRLFKGFFAAHRKTASLARELDGYKENGPMWEYLIRGMNKAGDHEATMRADATHRLSTLLDPILKGGKFGGKGKSFPTINGSLNRGEQIVIALNMGNAGNMQRLLDGRGWQIEQLVPVMNNLTSADWNFVQNIWDFFESYRPLIAEKERRVMGKEPNWIEPQRLTVTTKEGEQIDLRGGYFPIVYDPRQSGRAEQFADAEAAKQMMRGAFNAATTRRSFTKDRAEEVTGRPLILTWDALFRGVNDVIHDLTWHEWVIDANRIIKNESLDHAIRTGFGADVIAQFKSAIADIAKGDSPDMDTLSKVLTPLRSGAAVAGLGFNLMNAMIQPLGLTQSMVRIGTRWVALGVAEWAKSPIGLVKQVHEKSEFMRNRARTLNREVNEVQSIVQGKGEIREKLDALMFAPMQSLQLVADMPTWWGAYQKALADPALIDAENGVDEATAIARADQAVLDSQGGGQIKDLARVQRGGNIQKLFTLFYGYFSAAYNLGVDRTKQTNFKSPIEVMGLAWDFLLLYSVPSVLSTLLVEAFTPSGDDGDDWEKIAKKLAANQVSYLMGLMIGLREATGTVQYLTGTKMFDTAYGGPAGLRFFQELDKLGKQIGQGELDRALARSLINVGGIALHLPSAQINRTVDGVIAISEGETQNPGAILFGFQR